MSCTLIIGAGSGIGAAVAKAIAGPGTELLLHTGRNAERLAAVASACREAGATVETTLGDTGAADTFGPIEGWVNARPGALTGVVFAAGYAKFGKVQNTPVEPVETALQAMPAAFHRLVASCAPRMPANRGRIVCVSAFGAHVAKAYSYCATAPAKAALEAQVRVFAANLAPSGITVNAVVPGFIAKDPGTPSSLTPAQWAKVEAEIPMGRVGRPAEVAALIAFLLGERAGYVTGQAIHANGGLTL
ncbi:SDR family oxidoreductase [Acuticoccus sp. MNP-M23]|uniref:SDR family NAD(P)-dependent oxidoreductase n=1 Tax=Acuticoccus sp. MNP-M23 TaxID=3072793 RepID=UPI0028153F09|nr:SDR family oxidoreductase [Acuticoccus sp. MNP-M23]WMS41990.1 SDR family oxidoreductase [Acuticoccus sp. MNP-M23]